MILSNFKEEGNANKRFTNIRALAETQFYNLIIFRKFILGNCYLFILDDIINSMWYLLCLYDASILLRPKNENQIIYTVLFKYFMKNFRYQKALKRNERHLRGESNEYALTLFHSGGCCNFASPWISRQQQRPEH